MEDYLNRKKSRNFNNTNTETYNCGGYALDTYSWYSPGNEFPDDENLKVFVEELLDEPNNREEQLLNYCVQNILNDFPQLKTISKLDFLKLPIDKKVISFRVFVEVDDFFEFIDYDFHFKLRKDGIWTHKRGSLEIEECSLKDWSCNGHRYTSETIYFIENI